MEPPQLLITDDDPMFLKLASASLSEQGYRVRTADTGAECVKQVCAEPPDLLLLDLVLPDLHGTEVCRRLKRRAKTACVPIIVVTGNDAEGQEISCLDLGADDYLLKPIHWERLVARCRSLLRRAPRLSEPPPVLDLGWIRLDHARKSFTLGRREYASLTPMEFEVLYQLARVSPAPLAKEDLYRRAWKMGPPSEISLKTVEVHARRIRLKLGARRRADILVVPGRGYALIQRAG